MNAECRDIEALLSPYADGELEAADARRVEAHVAACAACRATLEAWRESEAALASLHPARSDVEWERLARRVEAVVGADEGAGGRATVAASDRPPRKAGRSWLWAGSGVLAAAALVGLFWPWVVKGPDTMHEEAAPARQAAPTERELPATLEEDAPSVEPPPVEPTPVAPSAVAPTPIADAKKDAFRPLDVRRVAIAQEQKEQGMLSAQLAPDDRPVPPAAAAPASPGKASDEDVAMRSEPGGGARPVAELRDRAVGLAKQNTLSTERSSKAETGTPPGEGADAWFERAELAATAALRTGEETEMQGAAAELEEFLRDFPSHAHRTDALAQRARRWAALAAQDPAQCALARSARADWQVAAGAGVAFPDPQPAALSCP